MTNTEPQLRILVVDNQPEMRLLLSAFLTSRGYAVELRRSAETALQAVRCKAKPIAAIVTDIGMSPMDGMALLVAVKAERPELPVILMTGEPDEAQRRAALAQGAGGYLAKPFSLEEIQRVLAAALRTATVLPRPLSGGSRG